MIHLKNFGNQLVQQITVVATNFILIFTFLIISLSSLPFRVTLISLFSQLLSQYLSSPLRSSPLFYFHVVGHQSLLGSMELQLWVLNLISFACLWWLLRWVCYQFVMVVVYGIWCDVLWWWLRWFLRWVWWWWVVMQRWVCWIW